MSLFQKMGLVHRIIFHNILMILALALSAVITFHLVGRPLERQQEFARAAAWITQTIESTAGSRAAVTEALRPFHEITQSPMTVYRPDGTVLVNLDREQIPPLDSDQVTELFKNDSYYHRRFGEVAFPLHLTSGPAYLLFHWKHIDRMRARFVVGIFVALVVIGLMSVPLARSISTPLRRITETAAKLRDGDLTARATVKSHDELAVLGNTLNDMAEGLSRRIRREKELLANVSHELRTPLARIRVALEIASEADGDTDLMTRQLGEITTDIQELEQLVNDVLFATRLDLSTEKGAPDLPLNLEPVSLVHFLLEIVERFETWTGRTVQTALPDDAPAIEMDRALFRRVIDNLLDNSRIYSGKDAEISVVLRLEENAVVMEVRDRGMGVSPENLSRLFEPFFRTEKSRNRNAGGMGLGLTLSQRIVAAHGGSIAARQRSGGGLVVSVALPVEQGSDPRP